MPSRPNRQNRVGRNGRGHSDLSARGIVRVDPDFETEYPDGDSRSTEAYASLCRTGDALLAEIARHTEDSLDISQTASTALAIIDGAGESLTPSEISERLLIPSATMTSTLDALENRGWCQRVTNPADRRSVLIEITPEGRAAADRMLPGIRNLERAMMSGLSPAELEQLVDLLARIMARANEIAEAPPTPLDGPRVRPARLA